MKLSRICLSLLAITSISAIAESEETSWRGLIKFERPFCQSEKGLAIHWKNLGIEKQKQIESFLLMRLGLSSTGIIQLIGRYMITQDEEIGKAGEYIFQFQQCDLFGGRLFWSVLVNPQTEKVLMLYHINSFRAGEVLSLTEESE